MSIFTLSGFNEHCSLETMWPDLLNILSKAELDAQIHK